MQRGGLDPRQVPLAGYEPQCLKIVKDLQSMPGASFVATDAGFANVQNYAALIPHPTSFEAIINRVQGKAVGPVKKYTYLNDFALDIRRIPANFFRFNYFADGATVKNRKDFARILFKFEQSWLELQNEIGQSKKGMYFTQPLPELKWCLAAFEEAVKVKTGEKHPIDDFIHPITFYFPSPADLKAYKSVVKNPICFAEVLSKLVECSYDYLDQVRDDVDAIVNSCSTYWSQAVADKILGGELIKSAMQLQTAFLKSLKASETAHVNNPIKANAPTSNISLMQRYSAAPIASGSSGTKTAAAPSALVPAAATAAGKGAAAGKGKVAPSVTSAASTTASGTTSSGGLKLKLTATSSSAVMPPSSAPVVPEVVSLSSASAAALERKIDKYLRAAIKLSLDGIKEHYLLGTVHGASMKVQTARPFLRAVDPLQFPDYATIISDPIDITKIEKRLNTDRYSSLTSCSGSADLAVGNILRDLTLLRDNAHTYNTGKENVEVRIMADCLLNYFKYLLRECLKFIKQQTQLKDHAALMQTVFSGSTPAITKLLGETTAPDVRTYIEVSKRTAEKVIRESDLPKLLGVASTSTTATSGGAAACGGTAGGEGSSSSSSFVIKKQPSTSSASATAPSASATTLKAKKISSPAPKAVTYYDDEEGADEGEEYLPGAHYSGTNAAGKPIKRNMSLASAGASTSTDYYEGSMGGAVIAAVETYRERAPWELAAEEVWKHLRRHVFVDLSKPTVIADFFHPVAMVDPAIAADYAQVIARPMDLTTLINMLNTGTVLDSQEFLELAITIFQNAIDYNSRHQADSSYAAYLVQRCELLKKFTNWIALETLPVQDDTGHANPVKLGYLRKSQQQAERKIRDDILNTWYISDTGSSPYTECNKLLKDLQRGRNKQESQQIYYFQVPVDERALADYSVYVRNPTDLSTIKYRLDGTLPGHAQVAAAIDKTVKRYTKYGEFVSDLRRVFSNAIKYNSAHLASDTTGITKLVYEAALFLQEKLEGLLSVFSVHLADRIERARITNAEAQQRNAEARAKQEKEEAAARQFEQQYLAELKSTDHVFAADYDLEQKSKLTELQLKAHILAQQRAMLNANSAANTASMEDLGKDIAADDTSQGGQMSPLTAAAGGMLFGSGMQMNGNVLGLAVPPFPGYGVSGKVPGRYAHLVALKMSVRDKAWQLWQTAPGVVTHQTHARALKALAARNAQIGSSRGANNSAPSAGSSNGNISAGSSGNARNDALQPNAKVRREGMNIKLTTTTTPGNNASSTAAATSTASVKSTTAAATITSNGAGPSQQPAPSSSTEAGTDSAGGGPDNEASLMSTEPSQELLESAEVENPGNEETAVGEGNGNSNEDGGAMDLDTTESTQEISSSSSTVAVLQSSADSPAPVPGDSSSSSSSSVLGKKVKTQFVLGGAAAAKKRRVLLNPPSSGCFLMDTYIDES